MEVSWKCHGSVVEVRSRDASARVLVAVGGAPEDLDRFIVTSDRGHVRNASLRSSLGWLLCGCHLQLTTRYVTGSERVRFVEAAQVKEVFINEATRLTHVIFYMGVVIRGAAKGDPARQYSIVVPFKELEPPLMHLKPVYLGTRALLMGEAEEVADEQRERPDG